MAKEICISSTPHETRLAILEDDQLAEIYYERENEYTLAGSIYNGRVTRVLPGMQSAFVDVGLERDAFLYVTDFVELEDPEETDEIERAASSPAPREVRPGSALAENRSGEVAAADKPARSDGRSDRSRSDRRPNAPAPDDASQAVSAPPAQPAASGAETAGDDESGETGGRRWRGRRRRRGAVRSGEPSDSPAAPSTMSTQDSGAFSGSSSSQQGAKNTSENTAKITVEAASEGGVEEVVLKPSGRSGRESRSRRGSSSRRRDSFSDDAQSSSSRDDLRSESEGAAVPFVLPGESLSRHGGASTPQDTAADAQLTPAPVRPSSSFKPPTMIEAPLVWDGSGLLPGESLSRHRPSGSDSAKEQPVEESSASSSATAAASQKTHTKTHTDLETVVDSKAKWAAIEEAKLGKVDLDDLEELDLEEVDLEEMELAESGLAEPGLAESEMEEEVSFNRQSTPAKESHSSHNHPGSASHKEDASASHHVDPNAPTGFRLFGFGKKKEAAAAKPAQASSYSPGKGHIEEELIDEEEFDSAPRQHARAGDSDHDDLEEETLKAQIGLRGLGDLLQDEGDDEDGEGTAAGAGSPTAPGRRDRNARGRRGRNGSPAPAGGSGAAPRRGSSRRSSQTSNLPVISDLLKPGQEILVQIAKEPIAKKGARITSHIALPGRFLVFMPTVGHVGVSRKIESDEERQRLKRILINERGEATGGFIVRTAAEGASEEELRADLRFLLHLWAEIKTRSEGSKSPALIYHDLSLVERILRDQVSDNFSSIWVDSEADYERIVRFLNRFSPALVRRVKLYTKDVPLFEHFGIQDEISKALRSKVWLKSGGSIVINQTEALVAIDINTGKFVGKTARLEDTILKTNLDAIPEIVRQVRLRDLGGIIVIDFIDMDERKNRNKVMAALEEALKADRAPTKVLQFNDFGLVAITRKRVKQSLERTLSVPCPVCQATGMVKSSATVCNEIYIELRKMKKHFENADVMLRVHPETVKVLKSNNASWLSDYEELIGKNILVKSDATLHPEQFDIQG